MRHLSVISMLYTPEEIAAQKERGRIKREEARNRARVALEKKHARERANLR